MTKTIKFNLILDGEPVRTLDQLKDNFNIDDILQHYKSGVLQRWLETRGIEEELKKINKIKGSNLIETAKNLSEIFNKNISIEEIGHAVYHLQIKQDEEDRLKRTNRIKNDIKEVVLSYHQEYEKICQDIEKKKNSYAFLKNISEKLCEEYWMLFELDYERFFRLFSEKSPLILFTMISCEKVRKSEQLLNYAKKTLTKIIPNGAKKFKKSTNGKWEHITNKSIKIIEIKKTAGIFNIRDSGGKEYDASALKENELLNGLSIRSSNNTNSILYSEAIPPFTEYYGKTEGWNNLEPKGKKCLILKIGKNGAVKNAGAKKQELNEADINGNFPITLGLDYKSDSGTEQIIYFKI